MRLEIHHKIAKKICEELKELGLHFHKESFLLGNLFPDLIHSYFWCKHEYPASRNILRKKIEQLKKRPIFFSFRMGVLTHYISDYFCYPHTRIFDQGMAQHIMYELRQKVPKRFYKLSLVVKSFAIEELDKLIALYENIRPHLKDNDYDFHMAVLVASGFFQAAYKYFSYENFKHGIYIDDLVQLKKSYPIQDFETA